MFEWIIRGSSLRLLVLLLASLLSSTALMAESVAVRYKEGVSHGFLVLRTSDGKPIADGESTQVSQGDRVTNHMWFKFKDGSFYDQTTVFSQRGTFRLLRDHVLQEGPAFKRRLETSIDATSGEVTVRYTDDHNQEKVTTERLELPADVANGILFTLLQAWVLTGEAPAFARSDGPLFGDGPIFRMEVAIPAVWPDSGPR